MPEGVTIPAGRFTLICLRCDRPMLARADWSGREVQCPYCASVLRLPEAPPDGRAVRGLPPNLAPRRLFNFGCPRCDCLLEAHTGMCGHRANCPTCGARMTVPLIKPSGMPLPAELLDGEVHDPTPVHTYAASGLTAPKIIRRGEQTLIECPRCDAHSPIEANTCVQCGAPFTIEAAPTIGKQRRDADGARALTFGILGVLFFFALAPGLLAVFFGVRSAFYQGGGVSRSNTGLAGLILGLLSLAGGVIFIASRF